MAPNSCLFLMGPWLLVMVDWIRDSWANLGQKSSFHGGFVWERGMRGESLGSYGWNMNFRSCGSLSLIPHVDRTTGGTPQKKKKGHKYSERNRNESWGEHISPEFLTAYKFPVLDFPWAWHILALRANKSPFHPIVVKPTPVNFYFLQVIESRAATTHLHSHNLLDWRGAFKL